MPVSFDQNAVLIVVFLKGEVVRRDSTIRRSTRSGHSAVNVLSNITGQRLELFSIKLALCVSTMQRNNTMEYSIADWEILKFRTHFSFNNETTETWTAANGWVHWPKASEHYSLCWLLTGKTAASFDKSHWLQSKFRWLTFASSSRVLTSAYFWAAGGSRRTWWEQNKIVHIFNLT